MPFVNRTEIDIVALAGRRRVPVLAGEVKWAVSVDGSRLRSALERTAEALPGASDPMAYLVAARRTVRAAPPGTITVAAEDVFRA